jgi:hypothetical protein
MQRRLVVASVLLGFFAAACSCENDDGPSSTVQTGGAAGVEAGGLGGAGAIGGGLGDGSSDAGDCNGEICAQGFKCRYDACVPELGSCTTHDDCPGDSYCDANGECIPYGVPPDVINDPSCKKPNPPEGVTPVVQCEWEAPSDPGDPTAGSVNIYTAPMIADLNLDLDPGKLQPSIVVTTWELVSGARIGTLRIFDGRTCAEQLRIGGADEPTDENRPAYGTQWAIADLDGDVPSGGRPEIVGLHRTSGTGNSVPLNLYALKLDVVGGQPTYQRMWYGRNCQTNQLVQLSSNQANYGPGIWDLDDDGVPEIVVDQLVFGADGCLLSPFADFDYLTHGPMSTVADADLDGMPDLVRFDRIAGWDAAQKQWVNKPWFVENAALHKPGHVAIADLGQYSTLPGVPAPNQLPELIVVSAESTTFNPNSSGSIRVQAVDGSLVWGPLPLYSDSGVPGGHGGPPTASDFDGDGQVEFAAAANQYYVVYDPDCVAALGGASPPQRPGGKCDRDPAMAGLPDGILWAQPSQDFSSSGTGSSIFDFDGNGTAEAVCKDECYVRVYNGRSGAVIFSAPASSGTGFEFPTIADVDGDFATEIVVPRTLNGPSCPASDPLFPAATGFTKKGGFSILRDPQDLWASSRPIWNQHAYSITHVTDDGRVPSSSQTKPNWTQPGLNNFRQNTQGDLGLLEVADLTVLLTDLSALCQGTAGTLTLEAQVCNRGTNPVKDGVTVEFYEGTAPSGDAGASGTVVCQTMTTKLLAPGQCELVECTGEVSGQSNVFVVVDPKQEIADCHPGNNDGAGTLQLCPS